MRGRISAAILLEMTWTIRSFLIGRRLKSGRSVNRLTLIQNLRLWNQLFGGGYRALLHHQPEFGAVTPKRHLSQKFLLVGRFDEDSLSFYFRSVDGAQGRNRTTDTRIFSPLLYQLSYLGARCCRTRGRAPRCPGRGERPLISKFPNPVQNRPAACGGRSDAGPGAVKELLILVFWR